MPLRHSALNDNVSTSVHARDATTYTGLQFTPTYVWRSYEKNSRPNKKARSSTPSPIALPAPTRYRFEHSIFLILHPKRYAVATRRTQKKRYILRDEKSL